MPHWSRNRRDLIDLQRGVGEIVARDQKQRAGTLRGRLGDVVDDAVAVVVLTVDHLRRWTGGEADPLPVEAGRVAHTAGHAARGLALVRGHRQEDVHEAIAIVVDAVTPGLDRFVVRASSAGGGGGPDG